MAKEKTPKENPMQVINQDIANGTFRSIYLLYGSERYLIQQSRDALLKALVPEGDTFNFVSYSTDQCDVQQIVSDLGTMPFLADRRVVLVEDSGFFKAANEPLANALETIPETSVIIFCEYEKVKGGDYSEVIKPVDARLKLFKTVKAKDCAFEFSSLDERTLLIWLKRKLSEGGKKVEDAAVYRLYEGTGNNMQALSLEAEKLYSYCLDKDTITVQDADAVTDNRLQDKVFDMIEALSRHDKDSALLLYHDISQLKENIFGTLTLITRHYTILLTICEMKKAGADRASITKTAGIPPFFYSKYDMQASMYSYDKLKKCLELCVMTDFNIKTGALQQTNALERLIIDLLTV